MRGIQQTPIAELGRVFPTYDLTLLHWEDPQDAIRLHARGRDVQARLGKADLDREPVDGHGSAERGEARERFFHLHNLENKWRDAGFLRRPVYRYVRAKLPKD